MNSVSIYTAVINSIKTMIANVQILLTKGEYASGLNYQPFVQLTSHGIYGGGGMDKSIVLTGTVIVLPVCD